MVPTMSEGSRSGVNWMRWNFARDRGGERLDRERLGEARHPLDQDVAVCEQAHEHAWTRYCWPTMALETSAVMVWTTTLSRSMRSLTALDLVRLDRHLVLRSEFRVREPVGPGRGQRKPARQRDAWPHRGGRGSRCPRERVILFRWPAYGSRSGKIPTSALEPGPTVLRRAVGTDHSPMITLQSLPIT
jgi:hypothetical protein